MLLQNTLGGEDVCACERSEILHKMDSISEKPQYLQTFFPTHFFIDGVVGERKQCSSLIIPHLHASLLPQPETKTAMPNICSTFF